MNVHDTRQLVVLFRDVAALPGGEVGPPRPASAPAPASPQSPPVATGGLPVAIPNAPTAQPPNTPTAQPPEPRRPIDLAADTVQAFVLRLGEQNALEQVDCEGGVRVHQDPATPQEKPIHMRGQTLRLTRHAAGNVLVVTDTESSARPAEVHFPDLSLIGPRITIDQAENEAAVEGVGSMRLVTQTDMSGNKLAKPTPLEVHWKQSMHFGGKVAQFHGNVQADQDNTRLLCSNMEVQLDRPVSLNQPGQLSRPRAGAANPPAEPPVGVDTVICDGTAAGPPVPVTVEETTADERGRLARYQRIESRELIVHREDGDVNAPGPGVVRIFQLGPKDESAPGPGTAPPKPPAARGPAKPAQEEFKLTLVTFTDRVRLMNAKRSATFYGHVEVIHLPTEDWNLRPDPNRLPAGALHLRCGKLNVYSGGKDAAGRTAQQMEASIKASVEVDGHLGYADVIKFDERDQKVIFVGTDDNPAHLYKVNKVGEKPDDIKGRRIEYNRLNGTYKTDDARNINIGQ
jgi:lipopolysaccharide export system protein LptA